MRMWLASFAAVAMLGCAGEADGDAEFRSGSCTLASCVDGQALYASCGGDPACITSMEAYAPDICGCNSGTTGTSGSTSSTSATATASSATASGTSTSTTTTTSN